MTPFELLNKKIIESQNYKFQPIKHQQIIDFYNLILGREPTKVELDRYIHNSMDWMLHELFRDEESIFRNIQIVTPIISPTLTIEEAQILYNFELQEYHKGCDPKLESISSQLCTKNQYDSSIYNHWCEIIKEVPRLHRKQWEFVYILEALSSNGFLTNGKKGLGFGCGKEPLAAAFAAFEVDVLCTDLPSDESDSHGWAETNQNAQSLQDIYREGVCDKNIFNKKVKFMNVDMNRIPPSLIDYDFVWSSCALEHLGSIQNGIDFIINSSRCLKIGGIAVHTTEYNISSNDSTFEHESCVFFRKKDFEKLEKELGNEFELFPINYSLGTGIEDQLVDLPPYKSAPHLRLAMFGYLTTSIGIIIRRLM